MPVNKRLKFNLSDFIRIFKLKVNNKLALIKDLLIPRLIT